VIDLHSHILPGLDDGAGDIEVSLRMARIAVEEGVQTMVATPHVNFDYPVDADMVISKVGEVNVALARAGVPLAVLPGAEISMARAAQLSDAELRAFALARGPTVLVESPYVKGAGFLDELLFDLQLRGFRPLLAHPERCPTFQDDVGRLRRLVERDVACSVNAQSLAGRFGTKVRDFALLLVREGLVHDVASDSHDDSRRPPGMRAGIAAAEEHLAGISALTDWLTQAAPAALLAGRPLPARPDLPAPEPQPRGLRRLLGRGRR
jgi:protein-tyrosine phosphatase